MTVNLILQGHVSSYYGMQFHKHTAYHVSTQEDTQPEIRQILTMDHGVLSLTSTRLRLNLRRAQSVYSYTSVCLWQSFRNLVIVFEYFFSDFHHYCTLSVYVCSCVTTLRLTRLKAPTNLLNCVMVFNILWAFSITVLHSLVECLLTPHFYWASCCCQMPSEFCVLFLLSWLLLIITDFHVVECLADDDLIPLSEKNQQAKIHKTQVWPQKAE